MAKVKQSRTEPEERVARALRELGHAYRRNVRTLPGKPDFANQSKGWAIQVHGCFWHRHDCKRATVPAHHRSEWQGKFARNQARDARVETALTDRGLRVLTLWECEIKNPAQLKATLSHYLK